MAAFVPPTCERGGEGGGKHNMAALGLCGGVKPTSVLRTEHAVFPHSTAPAAKSRSVSMTLTTLRPGQAVVEVVKDCAEEFMFDRRILTIVEGLLEDGVMESVGPIASEVYHKAIVSRPGRYWVALQNISWSAGTRFFILRHAQKVTTAVVPVQESRVVFVFFSPVLHAIPSIPLA